MGTDRENTVPKDLQTERGDSVVTAAKCDQHVRWRLAAAVNIGLWPTINNLVCQEAGVQV